MRAGLKRLGDLPALAVLWFLSELSLGIMGIYTFISFFYICYSIVIKIEAAGRPGQCTAVHCPQPSSSVTQAVVSKPLC